MPDTRADYNRLFCRICTNRAYTIESGIVCGLTNKKPDFVGTCPDFQIDDSEIRQIGLTTRTKLFENHFQYLDRVSQFRAAEKKPIKPTKLYESKYDFIYTAILYTIIYVFFIVETIRKPVTPTIVMFGVLTVVLPFIYRYCYRRYKRNKVVITIDLEGFIIDGERTHWIGVSEILIKRDSRTDSYDFKFYTYFTSGTYTIKHIDGTKKDLNEVCALLKTYWYHSGHFIDYPIEE